MITFMCPFCVSYRDVREVVVEQGEGDMTHVSIPCYRLIFSQDEFARLTANVSRMWRQVSGDRHLTWQLCENDRRFGFFHNSEDDESWFLFVRCSHEEYRGFSWKCVGKDREILITGSGRDLHLFWRKFYDF